MPVPKRRAITFPGVGGTFVCGAEHGSALVDGVAVDVGVDGGVWLGDGVLLRVGVDVCELLAVCVGDVVDAAVRDGDADDDDVNVAAAVTLAVDRGDCPSDTDADAVAVNDGVEALLTEAVVDAVEALVADGVVIEPGAIASERYSVLLHACAMAERAPLTVL